MRKTRTIVAVTLLATALCADRASAVAAARAGRGAAEASLPNGGRDRSPHESGQQSFAQRLTRALGRVVSTMRLHASRQDGLTPIEVRGDVQHAQALCRGVEGTPFQFRLPPPGL